MGSLWPSHCANGGYPTLCLPPPGLRWPIQTRQCPPSCVPSPPPLQSGVVHLRRGGGSHGEVPQDKLQIHHRWQGKMMSLPVLMNTSTQGHLCTFLDILTIVFPLCDNCCDSYLPYSILNQVLLFSRGHSPCMSEIRTTLETHTLAQIHCIELLLSHS